MKYIYEVLKMHWSDFKNEDWSWHKLIEQLVGLRFGMFTDTHRKFNDILHSSRYMDRDESHDFWQMVSHNVYMMLKETEHLRRKVNDDGMIQRTMVMSTTHLRKEFNDEFTALLGNRDAVSPSTFPVTIYRLGEVGYVINVAFEDLPGLGMDQFYEHELKGIEEVVPVALLAWVQGCSTVIVDKDGPKWTQLQQFGW